MNLSKDEIIKKLALGIVRNIHIHAKRYQCHFCKAYDREHSSDCPVLLAEEVLRDCQKCTHVGAENECNCINGNRYEVKCEECKGTGWRYPEYVKCRPCGGTGVKK